MPNPYVTLAILKSLKDEQDKERKHTLQEWEDLKFWKGFGRHVVDAINYQRQMSQLSVWPSKANWYKAFELTPFTGVRCVILGQDPYPTPGHAHGLAFSVPPHVKRLPQSLRNIFQEYKADLGYPQPRFGDLTPWAREGVLLLNAILTCEAGRPLSHAGMGWEKLTVEVIQKLSEFRDGLSFIFWGKKAQEYKGLVSAEKHQIICSSHPSPLSARNGFFGSRPFSTVNQFQSSPINWRLP